MNKSRIGFILAALAPLTLLGQVSPKAVRSPGEIEPLLASISTYEFGQSREPEAQFTQLVQDSMANPAMLQQIESSLLAFVQSGATAAGKQVAFRELSLVGTDTSVPVLAPMLLQPSTAEMARFALARIPGDAAGQALRDSLAKSSGSIRIGITGSLGQRHDSKAVPALAQLAFSNETATAEAALAALGDIADRPALNALAQAHSKASGAMEQRAAEAYLDCADRFAARGDKPTALGVYKQLMPAKEPAMIQVAALSGFARIDPKAALPLLATAMQSSDARVQFAAIRFTKAIPGSESTAAMEHVFPTLAPPAKVILLAALADRGDRSSQRLFAAALKDASVTVRAAALSGLGLLGDGSTVTVLADAAASGTPAEQAAARQSLNGIHGSGIDAALVSAIGSSNGKVKAELLLAAGERGSTATADAVLQAVHDTDPDVHREAMRAVKNVAGPPQIPTLVELVTRASNMQDRRDAGQALALALQRFDSAPLDPVVAAYKNASDVQVRAALIEALGRTSKPQVLELVRGSLDDPAPEIARASILALTDWADPTPMPDLLAVAKRPGGGMLQILALRGYIKLAGLPTGRPNAESARLLTPAAALAKEPAEKRALLAVLTTYPCQESLEMIQSMANDAAVANEANAAATRMQAALRGRGGARR
jgi:HEAT repeat protein